MNEPSKAKALKRAWDEEKGRNDGARFVVRIEG